MSMYILSLFSVRPFPASISATICMLCRPMLRPLMGMSKLPFVVPLLVTLSELRWLPSTYRKMVFVPLPLTL